MDGGIICGSVRTDPQPLFGISNTPLVLFVIMCPHFLSTQCFLSTGVSFADRFEPICSRCLASVTRYFVFHDRLLTEPLLLRRPLPPPVRLCWPAPVRGCDCVLTGGGLARVPLPDAPLRPGRFAYSSPCLRAGGGAASGNATLAPPSMGMRHHHHHQ